jgi:hypothetical protein
MKSIAGSIVVLAGALIMGLASKEIPNQPIPTIFSFGLVTIGLILVFSGSRHNKCEKE